MHALHRLAQWQVGTDRPSATCQFGPAAVVADHGRPCAVHRFAVKALIGCQAYLYCAMLLNQVKAQGRKAAAVTRRVPAEP